ncbi:ParA family protein [Spiroplasma poulsonii]|nr:ParA family protein [Spiroplasma poulsonii]MBW3059318.1 hypothetical protein [Spiroplasma poulsonii]
MKMISFCNKKGGVGKTTLCKNVAYKFALDGSKVLLIDLDPQATLTLQSAKKNIENNNSIVDLISSKNAAKFIKINNIIIKSKYKNIDIIMGNESLSTVSALLNTVYSEKEKYLLSDMIYQSNEDIFNSYDYVLIDYPPTINELSVSFLMLSDLIIVPINDGINSVKGVLDLKNTLNNFCRLTNKNVPLINIIFNQVKDNNNLLDIKNALKENNLDINLSRTMIVYSDTYKTIENEFNIIWENPYYWRQKQAYEELIKEIK